MKREWPTCDTWTLQISPKQGAEQTIELFREVKKLIGHLSADVGYADRLFLFDDEKKFKEAQLILCTNGIEWMSV